MPDLTPEQSAMLAARYAAADACCGQSRADARAADIASPAAGLPQPLPSITPPAPTRSTWSRLLDRIRP